MKPRNPCRAGACSRLAVNIPVSLWLSANTSCLLWGGNKLLPYDLLCGGPLNDRFCEYGDPPAGGIALKISIKSLFTFPVKSCIVVPEQSKRQRVKCHRDGEFARRTKECSTMLSLHPLLHMGNPPLCSNDTRSGEWSAVYCCPIFTGTGICKLPDVSRQGFLFSRQPDSFPSPT